MVGKPYYYYYLFKEGIYNNIYIEEVKKKIKEKKRKG